MSIKFALCAFTSLMFISPGSEVCAQALKLQVSQADTQKFLKQFEQVDENQKQAWKTFADGQVGRISQIPGAMETWVQAANKQEPCKVYAATFVEQGKSPWWEKAGNYVNWDGSCINGYASGLGREFSMEEGELSAWLAEYQGVKQAPKYYLVTNYSKQTVEFRAASHPLYVSLQYALNTNITNKMDKQLAVNYSVFNVTENRLYRRDGAVGFDQVSKSQMLANRNSYAVVQSSHPMATFSYHTSVNSKWERMGYSIVNHSNGVERKIMQMFNATPTQTVEVTLPDNYIEHLKNIDTKIHSNLNAGVPVLQATFAAITQYQTRLCQGTVKVDFMDSGMYGRICLEQGELSVFKEMMSAALEQQKQRHDQARIEIARRTATMANSQTAQIAATSGSTKKIAAKLQQFADDTEKSSQRVSDFFRSVMSGQAMPGGQQMGQMQSKVICVLVENVVQCNTR